MKSKFFLYILLIATLIFNACSRHDTRQELDKANNLILANKNEEAALVLSNLLENEPSNYDALKLRADCYAILRAYALQISDLKQLLKQPNQSSKDLVYLTNEIRNAYIFQKQLDSAIIYGLMSINYENQSEKKLFPLSTLYRGQASLYASVGKYDLAIIYSDSARILGDSCVEYFSSRSRIYYLQGKLDSAIYCQSKAISENTYSNNDLALSFLTRANLYHQTDQPKLACADWQKALELGNMDAQAKLDSFCVGN